MRLNLRAFRLPVLFVCLAGILPSNAQTAGTSGISLQDIIARFGGSVPQSSLVTADVEITTGTTQEQGSLRVLTRAASASVEEWSVGGSVRRVTSGTPAQSDSAPVHGHQNFHRESVTQRSALFPLPWLAARAALTDLRIEDLGVDADQGQRLRHLRLNRVWQPAGAATARQIADSELWLDPSSGLPARISFRDTGASVANAAVQVLLEYSDYRRVDGMLYPFRIKQYLNGSLWADIRVHDVQFNANLTDADFSSK